MCDNLFWEFVAGRMHAEIRIVVPLRRRCDRIIGMWGHFLALSNAGNFISVDHVILDVSDSDNRDRFRRYRSDSFALFGRTSK